MDVENERLLKEFMDQAAGQDSESTRKNILPLYVSQTRKMSKMRKEVELFTKTIEEHSKIILKHDNYLKDCLTMSVYDIK